MKLLLLILLVGSVYGQTTKYYQNQLRHLSEEQQTVMNFVAYNAEKEDLKYTMLSIAFIESQFGKYKINLNDPSCGIFHKLLPIYAIQLSLKPSKWNESRLCEQLIKSPALALKIAIEDFKHNYIHFRTKGYSKNVSWRLSVMSYNAGISNYKAGSKYYREIVKIIKTLHKLEY